MNNEKLELLARLEGYVDIFDMLNRATMDSIVPCICTNMECDYTIDLEPDQDAGWCETCGTPTVQSCLILAELI